jgi:hypothetical protein
MRLHAIVAGVVSLSAALALPQTASAQEIIVGAPPGYGVTIIQRYPAPPPPAVVIRPAPPPAATYHDAPGIYAGYRGDGCAWLYRRAVDSGSPYWWSRYEECSE